MSSQTAAEPTTGTSSLPTDVEDIQFEIGLWLSGLESFLNAGNHSFIDRGRPKADHDWTKEARLVHSALLLCSKLSLRSE